jgi:hypothetical protein
MVRITLRQLKLDIIGPDRLPRSSTLESASALKWTPLPPMTSLPRARRQYNPLIRAIIQEIQLKFLYP